MLERYRPTIAETPDEDPRGQRSNTKAAREVADEPRREQELLWPARQHPNDLILPAAHPTRFPGTWVAIFEESLPMDQVNALRVEGFSLYKHVVACGNGNLQVIICEDPRPDDTASPGTPAAINERYKNYDHPYK